MSYVGQSAGNKPWDVYDKNEVDASFAGVTTRLNGIDTSIAGISKSPLPASNVLQGTTTLTNTILTNGFGTTLYTGNGTTQSIDTGIDMSGTQWGNDASESTGGMYWIKSRNAVNDHFLVDTVRGVNVGYVMSDSTSAQVANSILCTGVSSTGFSVGASTGSNNNAATYAAWGFQTTHKRTGVTNHGKAFTEHYNPYTGFTIIQVVGSGLVGHDIITGLGRKLSFVTVKNLNTATNHLTYFDGIGTDQYLNLNTTVAVSPYAGTNVTFGDDRITLSSFADLNGAGNSILIYGWANSYYDEGQVVGNYELVQYVGTGAAGNKIVAKSKPTLVLYKRTDAAADWIMRARTTGPSRPQRW